MVFGTTQNPFGCKKRNFSSAAALYASGIYTD